VEATEAALRQFQELGADCLVAVGGGSTIGLCKAIAWRTDAPQLAVPTTYSGSEVTNVLGETSRGEKKTQRSEKVLPEAVIYDLELTLGLPARVSATSGINAMAHAVEALYAKNRNPVASLMAEQGLKGLAASLPAIVRDPRDHEARGEAQYCGWLCGMCLATTAMALHHKLCHVLGGVFGLPHAETHAIVLPHVAAYNAPAAPEAMRRAAAALGAKDTPTALYTLARTLDVPLALKDIGMPPDGIDRVTSLALAEPYWNPRPLEADLIRALLLRAFEGTPPQSE
jgi:alcohol dehydrogenase class IV